MDIIRILSGYTLYFCGGSTYQAGNRIWQGYNLFVCGVSTEQTENIAPNDTWGICNKDIIKMHTVCRGGSTEQAGNKAPNDTCDIIRILKGYKLYQSKLKI